MIPQGIVPTGVKSYPLEDKESEQPVLKLDHKLSFIRNPSTWNLDIYLPENVEQASVESVEIFCEICYFDSMLIKNQTVSSLTLHDKVNGNYGNANNMWSLVINFKDRSVFRSSESRKIDSIDEQEAFISRRKLSDDDGDGEDHQDDDGDGDDHQDDDGDDRNGNILFDNTTPETAGSTGGSSCNLLIGDETQSFQTCFPVNGIGSDFLLGWRLENQSSGDFYTIHMGMSAQRDGYVAVGFPSQPGRMIGASAMILKTCNSCSEGAKLYEVFMTGESLNDVFPDQQLNASEIKASVDESTNRMAGSFSFTWPKRTFRRSILAQLFSKDKSLSDFPLIFAAGPVSSTDVALEHNNDGSSSVNLFDSAETVSVDVNLSGTEKAHMWLMTIGWGFFLPLGVLLAGVLKNKNIVPQELQIDQKSKPVTLPEEKNCSINNEKRPQKSPFMWFQIHRAVQTIGFILGAVGFALGFVANGGWSSEKNSVEVHRDIGMATAVLMFIQMSALVWRPSPQTKLRKPWSLWHVWIGRVVIILIIANMYYGMTKVEELGTWTWATYTAVLGLMLVAAIVNELITMKKPKL